MKGDPRADVRLPTPTVGPAIGTVKAYLTFYRAGRDEITGKTWLPGVPVAGHHFHPGNSMGEDFDRFWKVDFITWVFDADRWHLEIGLT